MSAENVVRFGTKKTLTEEETEKAALKQKYNEFKEASINEHQANMLATLEGLSALVIAGKLDSFVLVGRNAEKGYFLDITMINNQIETAPAFLAYAGKLEALKLDLLDLAGVGPHMDLVGDFFAVADPIDLYDEEDGV